jgi:acyl-CoA synthetase (AMP-forming)/AMP-acid ligase II
MPFIPNLGIAFEDVAARHAGRTALIYPATGERISYAELNRLVDRIAGALWARGLRQGDVTFPPLCRPIWCPAA